MLAGAAESHGLTIGIKGALRALLCTRCHVPTT
jgi:hypothetical protein